MGPLEGVKVLDLSRYLPGHYCTMILADLGAEVIKIEQPPGPNPPVSQETRFVSEFVLHRKKKSMGLNLKNPEAREVFYQLARVSDVVFESFRPGVVKRLGVDYETLSRMNPGIVCCSLSGYGQGGPYRDLPGHDVNYVSMAGLQDVLGRKRQITLVGDLAGGALFSVVGILSALQARQRTGQGQHVDVSMLDGVISMASALLMVSNWVSQSMEDDFDLTKGVPFCRIYRTKDDKRLALACAEPHFWENLCRGLGKEQYIPFQNDPVKRDEIAAAFQEVFLTRDRDEWFRLFSGLDTCVSPVYTLEETFSDAHVMERGMSVGLDQPGIGEVRVPGPPVRFSSSPPVMERPAPVPCGDTGEILLALGYGEEEISKLKEKGAAA